MAEQIPIDSQNRTGGKIGVIGSGLIGRNWAMLFAAAGFQVAMFDSEPERVDKALELVEKTLKEYQQQGLLRGRLSPQQQRDLMRPAISLKEAVCGAFYIQECVPEEAALKRTVFKQLDAALEEDDKEVILASSTSSIAMSLLSSELKHRAQTIVAHPVNPPYFVPLVEVCPAPYTDTSVAERTMNLMKQIGQEPILLKKEVAGFALNRIQYALINECWRLVQDGYVSVEDVDKVLPYGLGPRYAFMGPLQVCHLNADGFRNYCERYGTTVYNTSSSMGPPPSWKGAEAESIAKAMEEIFPLDKLEERRDWRDARLAALAKLKKDMDDKDSPSSP